MLEGGRKLFLEIPDLQPVNQLHLRLRLDSNGPRDIFLTVHRLDKPFTDIPNYQPTDRIIATHPLLADLSPGAPIASREAHTILQELQQLQDRARREAEQHLEGVAGRLRARGLLVQVHVVAEEQPAVAILRQTEAQGAGLIALETHGRRGLSRLLLGSVADKVIRGAHVPVLVRSPSRP